MAGTLPQIPGYEILGEIGKGAMGVVYKARQQSVDRIVAVKVLRPSAAKDADYIARFRREAKTAAKLSHTHIVNAIDAGEADGRHYFVMEYVEGSTVEDAMKKGKVYDEKAAVKIALAVAQALKHANERGMVHRDIKPANVMLTKDGNIKLADLGLARIAADAEADASEAGLAAGTPYYISPEQARGLPDVDIRADLYSLGATLYHMVTGRVPYQGATPLEVMKKHVSKKVELTPPDHLNTSLSSGFAEVVETLMTKDRDARYRTPEDLILDLECLQRNEPPRIAAHRVDHLSALAEASEDEAEDDLGFTSPSRPASAAASAGPSTAVIVLSALLAVSVLLNIVQLIAR
ncbi:MAG: serine/threonine-protein kinase [Isosphaeraceae bacterium]